MAWIGKLLGSLGRDRNRTSTCAVVVYTRQGCHLCEDARLVLVRHGLTPELVDIDADAELAARYSQCVPVVTLDGREYFRGRVNEVLLRRLLRAKEAADG